MDAPDPEYVLRLHNAAINCLAFSEDGLFLLSGDQDGHVAVWSLSTFRPLLFWKAHTASILTTETWSDYAVTHGRDNKIHVFKLPARPEAIASGRVAPTPSYAAPSQLNPLYSLDVNALAYCKFGLLRLDTTRALIAVPAVLEDDKIDIFHLPGGKRMSRSIGHEAWPINDKTGTVMALSLVRSQQAGSIWLLVGYEDGRVACFSSAEPLCDETRAQEGYGWDLIWYRSGHKEPIMGMTVSPMSDSAWTVGADHFILKWRLQPGLPDEDRPIKCVTQSPGRSSVAARSDGKIIATGGWSGSVEVYSSKSFKPLAILEAHRDSINAVAFAPIEVNKANGGRAWLAAAGKDTKITLWEIYPT